MKLLRRILSSFKCLFCKVPAFPKTKEYRLIFYTLKEPREFMACTEVIFHIDSQKQT